ncbi:protein S100-Z [Poecile atricapillus]|nr:protein S100-Z [Poecile atricapillus]
MVGLLFLDPSALTPSIKFLELGKTSLIALLSLISKNLCMGFERKVTVTFCDLGIFLHTPPLACKAVLLLTAMTSPLEDAMDTLIRIFHHYSGKEGDRYKLSKGELKELLTSELTDFLSGHKDPLLIDKIMNDLDSNKDNEVDFNEFVILVAALTVACNDFFEEQLKKERF